MKQVAWYALTMQQPSIFIQPQHTHLQVRPLKVFATIVKEKSREEQLSFVSSFCHSKRHLGLCKGPYTSAAATSVPWCGIWLRSQVLITQPKSCGTKVLKVCFVCGDSESTEPDLLVNYLRGSCSISGRRRGCMVFIRLDLLCCTWVIPHTACSLVPPSRGWGEVSGLGMPMGSRAARWLHTLTPIFPHPPHPGALR